MNGIMENPDKKMGLLGIGLLVLGVFLPLVSLPFVGTVNYYFNGHGDGTMILIIIPTALFSLVTSRYRLAIAHSIIAAVLCSHTLLNLLQVKNSDPMAQNLIQLNMGWLALYGGIILLFLAGVRGYKYAQEAQLYIDKEKNSYE